MAAYRRVYDSRHLQADCQEPGSVPEPHAPQSSMGYLYLLTLFNFFLRRFFTSMQNSMRDSVPPTAAELHGSHLYHILGEMLQTSYVDWRRRRQNIVLFKKSRFPSRSRHWDSNRWHFRIRSCTGNRTDVGFSSKYRRCLAPNVHTNIQHAFCTLKPDVPSITLSLTA